MAKTRRASPRGRAHLELVVLVSDHQAVVPIPVEVTGEDAWRVRGHASDRIAPCIQPHGLARWGLLRGSCCPCIITQVLCDVLQLPEAALPARAGHSRTGLPDWRGLLFCECGTLRSKMHSLHCWPCLMQGLRLSSPSRPSMTALKGPVGPGSSINNRVEMNLNQGGASSLRRGINTARPKNIAAISRYLRKAKCKDSSTKLIAAALATLVAADDRLWPCQCRWLQAMLVLTKR